ncbi:MAG: protein-L-isoaspartate(D-aspartate) O-methyltransferase [Anaerolineales bacterium]|jgi:protein-L-isoaspartate(D-aspartate) O-methyltransferase
MEASDSYQEERLRMVRNQIKGRGVRDPRVLQAMREVPRHLFVPSEQRHLAYADGPLPIGGGQTISQPYIVALMTELLDLSGSERVLEVGTGSGYQAAVLSKLAAQVYSLDRISELAEQARIRLEDLDCTNVNVHVGDGSQGLPEYAPYDGILVTAAAPHVPEALKEQLADRGSLVLPVGSRAGQILERWTREGDSFRVEKIAPVAFVPLIGAQGWGEDEAPGRWWRSR